VTKSRGTYVPQLDALRGIAVAAVAYSHWVAPRYQFGVRWGTVGVTLFFVLSGYLISGILFDCRAQSDRPFALRSFYARRFLRIFPLYYLVLLILVAVNLPPVRQTIFWHPAYLSNFYFLYHGGWHGPISIFWTLAVEEQFYLFWPAVLLFVPKRAVPWAIAGLFAVGLASRLLLPVFIPEKPLLIVLPNMSFAAFGIGAFLAYAKQRPELMKFVPYAAVSFPLFAVSLWMRSTGGFHYGPRRTRICVTDPGLRLVDRQGHARLPRCAGRPPRAAAAGLPRPHQLRRVSVAQLLTHPGPDGRRIRARAGTVHGRDRHITPIRGDACRGRSVVAVF
jgi:peptidoglycan/LPS O-acetylase OafA/YrhL